MENKPKIILEVPTVAKHGIYVSRKLIRNIQIEVRSWEKLYTHSISVASCAFDIEVSAPILNRDIGV